MQLVLSVGNKVLDRVDIKPDLSKDEVYLQLIRRLLIVKNELSIISLRYTLCLNKADHSIDWELDGENTCKLIF